MRLIGFSKIVRTKNDFDNNTYTLTSNKIGSKLTLNQEAFEFIDLFVSKKTGHILFPAKMIPRFRKFIELLESEGFITRDDNPEPVFLQHKQHYGYLPLSSLSIEMTDSCNLNCIHCYGAFGNNNTTHNISFEKIRSLLPDMLALGTMNVCLTGGECFINPDFEEITDLLLTNGYNVSILTNGFLSSRIIEFLEQKKQYHFVVKVSLDGFCDTHNRIRNNEKSYINVIKTLDYLSKQKNIECYISSTLMKANYYEYPGFKEWIERRYPNCIHTTDLIFPNGSARMSEQCFSVSDFSIINKDYPSIFKTIHTTKTLGYRCSGGISMCTLTPSGNLKICNGAENPVFYFQHNAFETSLCYAWTNCGNNITEFRNERAKSTVQCLRCQKKESCVSTDCRIMAYLYNNSTKYSSPLTCFSTSLEFLK